MRATRHQYFWSEPADCMPGRVEARKRRESGSRPAIAVRGEYAAEVNSGCGHIKNAHIDVPKIVFHTRPVRGDVAVPKLLRDAFDRKQLRMAERKRRQIILKTIQVELSIGRNDRASPIGKQQLSC